MEMNFAVKVFVLKYSYFHSSANVDVHGSNNQIVEAERRRLNLKPLIIIRQVYVSSVLLEEVHAFTIEFCIRFLIGLVNPVLFFAFTISSCNWRMVRNLL